MATDVIAAAPAGIGSPSNMANGAFVSTGNASSLTLGFNPRWVQIINETDGIVWEKNQGMTPANTVKIAGVATTPASSQLTIDTTSAILFPADVGLNEPGSTVLLSSALCGTAKKISFTVLG